MTQKQYTKDLWSESLLSFISVTKLQEKKLLEKGVKTPLDLLLHLPIRFEDRSKITPINALVQGEYFQVLGSIVTKNYQPKQRRMHLILSDESGDTLEVFLFHCYYSISQKLQKGTTLLCYGQAHLSNTQTFRFLHPKWRLCPEKPNLSSKPSPVYPSMGLRSDVHQKIVLKTLEHLISKREKSSNALPFSLLDAMLKLHEHPKQSNITKEEATKYLAMEEILSQSLASQMLKEKTTQQKLFKHQRPKTAQKTTNQFIKTLPFEPTLGQKESWEKILKALQSSIPKTFLLQGDVGSGKTFLAMLASFYMFQGALKTLLICPTTILAYQHYQNFLNAFTPFGIKVLLLTGSSKAKERNEIWEALSQKEPLILISTQAIFHQDILISRLGLVIFDEQQRFGVAQRLHAFRQVEEKFTAHQLMLTATPIPRSMTMALYGEIDYHQLKEMPQGRKSIQTHVFPHQKIPEVLASLARFCQKGGKAYWVCPRIQEGSDEQMSSVEKRLPSLQQEMPSNQLFLLHGGMKDSQKKEVMKAFSDCKKGVLLCTTVIEVGVHVDEVNLIVIEGAERFGLSQLHQLRGRVGRGKQEAHCFLVPSLEISKVSKERLFAFKNSQDGFEISQLDLKHRGGGDWIGEKQSGERQFRIFDPIEHQELFHEIELLVKKLSFEDKKQLVFRWIGNELDYLRT